jgi:hypothetical protein
MANISIHFSEKENQISAIISVLRVIVYISNLFIIPRQKGGGDIEIVSVRPSFRLSI